LISFVSITDHRVGPYCPRIQSLAGVCNPWPQKR